MRAALRPVVLSLLLVGGFAFGATAQITIPIQGNVTKSGIPVDTTISMLFKLYNGGIVVWSETHPSVPVVGGVYSVQLGSITPIDTVSIWANLQLGITLGGDPELTPRSILGTSPTSISLINLRVREVEGDKGTSVNLIGGFTQNSDSTGVEAATISGGGLLDMPNKVNADGGTIGGGWDNIVAGETATVSGGEGHRATGTLSSIGGGMANAATAQKATVAGGENNTAGGDYSSITGGLNNNATATRSTVGGGEGNGASGQYSTIAGGVSNGAASERTFIGGGESHSATGAFSTITGGFDNNATGAKSTVGGGEANSVNASWATISGGKSNQATGTHSFIGAGESNQVSGNRSSVLGGFQNQSSGPYSMVGGGSNNKAAADYSTVIGGQDNQATAIHSTVLGGQKNAAREIGAIASGYNAKALHAGTFIWKDGTGVSTDSFVTTKINQFLIRADGGVGINENETFAPLHVTKNNIGVSADDVFNAVIVAEDADATIGVYSNPGGTWGSAINLIQMTSCGVFPCVPLPDFDNMWSMVRTTTGGGNDLYFRFGADTNYAANAGKLILRDNGDLEVQGALIVAGNANIGGNAEITGSLSKDSGTFKIDHPLDPENKYLYHSFVESPDMMNVYNGNVILNNDGAANVELPGYFEALNRDFRYQLTAIGAPGPNLYIASKIDDNRFSIAGGTPGTEVSWQVTGIRKDPVAKMHPVIPEVEKPIAERGTYLHPEAYGRDASESLVTSH